MSNVQILKKINIVKIQIFDLQHNYQFLNQLNFFRGRFKKKNIKDN